jgi:hypothetical protein
LFDLIILVENATMIAVARNTDCPKIYRLSVKVIAVSYLLAIVLKIVFYTWYGLF